MSDNNQIETIVVAGLDPDFCDEVAALPGGENIKKCFACGTCAAGCPVTNIDEEYNCRKIIRQVLLGMREEVLKTPVIWFCLMCYRCTSRCPQQVNFADIMKALRYLAIKNGFVSADMLANTNEVDQYAQILRRDIMKNTIEGRKKIIEELKAKIGKLSP